MPANSPQPRGPLRTGLLGIVLVTCLVLVSAGYTTLPFYPQGRPYTAYFANAAGLSVGDDVQIYGFPVGKVTALRLCATGAQVEFTVTRGIAVGDQTLAAIRTDTVLGQRALSVAPAGSGTATSIPLSRTTTPYTLSGALQDIGRSATDIDQPRFARALQVLTDALHDATPPLHNALTGLAALSHSINARDRQVDDLLHAAHTVSGVLAHRAGQLDQIINDGDDLFAALHARQQALATLIGGIDDVARQISGFVADNRVEFGPALTKLNLVLDNLNAHREHLDAALTRLPAFSTTLAEVVGSGPGFDANIYGVPPPNISALLLDTIFQPGKLPASLHDYLAGLVSERARIRPQTP
ncbi:MCE family protein [Candidatus Mycobacterium wuenschmannii]|uniref:MCE family protein n=1 Tax=Candidatus Mycobacterium wuenschmannii TaxID=3027808 RepID=A0ABY8W0U7_9MYCO|nr:MCE family protein [Candidatus Mycobacterium wuenschmannii]WIM88072.1 MCE family protein [Candidatus Mycobacterium wuenschmannii]